jgi:hypothetical protein
MTGALRAAVLATTVAAVSALAGPAGAAQRPPSQSGAARP